ncbi:hypothetical protein HYX06_03915 [Candidatus Woesearchaeota archaeon]|nr:hypothetical protein [Candidatus Woesearchaeota archaeon]
MPIAYKLSNAYRGVKYATAVALLSMLPSVAHAQQTNQNNNKQQTAQSQPEQETGKKPIFNSSISGDNLDGNSKIFVNGTGFVPYLKLGNNLFVVQGTGRYSRSNGGNIYEVDAGQVFNHLFGNGSLAQGGAFYQYRNGTGGLASLTSSFKSGRFSASGYYGHPLSKGRLVSHAGSSQISESEDGRITSATKITTDERLYEFVRKVATARGEFLILPDLKLAFGGALSGGLKGYVLEGSNFIEVRENVPDELRAIIGTAYSSGFLFGKNTEARVEVRAGQGKPQYSVVISTDFKNYTRKNIGNLRASLATPVDNLERIVTANSRVTRTTTENSATVSLGDCPETATEGSLYVCRINTDGIVEVVKGLDSLSLSSNTSNVASSTLASLANATRELIYSGEIDYDSAGEHPIELWVKNQDGLITKVKYTLVIQNKNRAPSVILPSEVPANEGQISELIFRAEDLDKEHVGRLALTAALYNGERLPPWITTENLTDAIKLILAPGYSDGSKTYRFLIRATDPEGAKGEAIWEQPVNNVNRNPVFQQPQGMLELREGQDYKEILSATDPDGDKLVYSGSNLPSWVRIDPSTGEVEYRLGRSHGEYNELTFTVSDGQGGLDTLLRKVRIQHVCDSAPVTMTSPERDVKITPGNSVNLESTFRNTDPNPSACPVSFRWVIDPYVSGAMPSFTYNVQNPGSVTFDAAGEYRVYVTAYAGSGISQSTTTVSVSRVVNVVGPSTPTLEAICSGSPSSGNTGDTITWTGTPSGGTGVYSHSWSGAVTATTQTATATYSTSGTKTANYAVTSGNQTSTASCGVTINAAAVTPSISINDVAANEGNAGTTNLTFTVTLSESTTNTVTVQYATANNTATAGSDYTSTSGTLTFSPGDTTEQFNVSITGDTTVESNETFYVNLTSPTNATISDSQGVGTITNDDVAGPPPI